MIAPRSADERARPSAPSGGGATGAKADIADAHALDPNIGK